MYCSKCGKEIPEGAVSCPACGPEEVQPTPVYESDKNPVKGMFNAPGKFGKSYAAIVTALLVFPATICTAIDFVFHHHDYWCDYVIGALLVFWVITVFPAMKITKPVVTSVIIFGSIVGYIYYIAYRSGHMGWLSNFVLPMLILTAAFIALDASLIGSKKIRGLHIFSLLSLECAAYLVCLEATLDNWINGAVELRWSVIVACGFISVIAVLEAFSYVGRINKK